MIDILKVYELKNKLFHLDTDISDDLFLNCYNNRNLDKYLEILDVTIYSTIKPMAEEVLNLDSKEIYNRCKAIIQKAINLSQYQYSENDVNKIILLYYFSIIPAAFYNNNLEENISLLESIVENNTNLPTNEQYINEELRIILLSLYQYNSNFYTKYEDKILYHLNIAKTMVDLRLSVNELFKG